MRKLTVTTVVCLLLASWSAASSAAGERSSQPLQIKADELLTDSAARTATFTGKVTARQGDITMYADRLVITYDDKNKGVDRVEAFGNVRISQGNRLAQAGHAVYDNNGGKIVLDNNPKMFQGDDVVEGKVITYFVNDQRSVVTSGPNEPVKVLIHPGDKGKK
jgi:lipopolysaccharide export system protein LptA